jgi:hypothetical protein
MWNRSSDVRNFALTDACAMSDMLNWLYPDEVSGTVWWVLGSALHKGIELTIEGNLTYEEGLYEGLLEMKMLLHANSKIAGTIESSSNRRKRSLDTIEADLTRMYGTWWDAVHPDGANRHTFYDDYDWPPRTEYMIELPDEVERTGAALFTEIDAIFEGGPEERPVAIVDWKSGSAKTADESQLHIYRYGLHRVGGWFPEGTGSMVGWFHHLDADKLQIVDPYIGDTVVHHWLKSAAAYKRALIENNTIPCANSYLCRNYNNAQPLCPCCAEGPEDVKSWPEILGRMERATLLEVPTTYSAMEAQGKDD